MIRRVICGVAVLAGLASATVASDTDPATAARAAAMALEEASRALEDADGARDRVRALTTTVKAYEAGLSAMRDGLRRVATREAELSLQLAAREAELAELIGVLQTIGAAPPPVLMLHPNGPLGAARSGMMLSDVTPALASRADALRGDLDEMQALRAIQENAAQTLTQGLNGVQAARSQLSQAVADRTDLPVRFTEDPIRTAILLSSTETLEGFADGLSKIATNQIVDTAADISDRKGELAMPVAGLVLRRSGEADAAGTVRPGILVAARPRALVTAPAAATIRYRGPLLDLGNVMILEPQSGLMMVFSGLAEVYGQTGQVIPEGAPVGLMGGAGAETGAILSLSGDGTGTDRSETLYIEVRQDGVPVDPEDWFQTDKDG